MDQREENCEGEIKYLDKLDSHPNEDESKKQMVPVTEITILTIWVSQIFIKS